MKKVLIVLWFAAVVGGILGYLNREKLECHERTYVRHGLSYSTTHCVVIDD